MRTPTPEGTVLETQAAPAVACCFAGLPSISRVIEEDPLASFSFQTVTNQSYTVQQTSDLPATNWTDYTNFMGNGSVYQFTVPISGRPRGFFRVVEP